MPILGVVASSITNNLFNSDYVALATATVGAGGASEITFSDIPNTYKHLAIRFHVASPSSAVMRVGNGSVDTGSNYAKHSVFARNTNFGAFGASSQTYYNLYGYQLSQVNVFCAGTAEILDYASTTKKKTMKVFSAQVNQTDSEVNYNSGLWNITSAITHISIFPESGGNFLQYSSASLYGIN